MRGKTCGVIVAVIAMAIGSMAHSGEVALKLADAWVPTTEKVGADVPLSLTIQNESGAEDTLLRVRCPVANFSERHTVDRGEGAPAMRSIKSIPIDTSGAVTLKPDGYHVMLLQTKQLTAGDKFTCSISFQKAGTMEVEVEVRQSH